MEAGRERKTATEEFMGLRIAALLPRFSRKSRAPRHERFCRSRSTALTDGVGGGFLPLLALPVVASDGAVGGLRLHRPPVGTDQDAGHHAQRAVACRGTRHPTDHK